MIVRARKKDTRARLRLCNRNALACLCVYRSMDFNLNRAARTRFKCTRHEERARAEEHHQYVQTRTVCTYKLYNMYNIMLCVYVYITLRYTRRTKTSALDQRRGSSQILASQSRKHSVRSIALARARVLATMF